MSEPPPHPAPSAPPRDSVVRWEGGSVPVSGLVESAPDGLGYELVLWVESGSGRVVGVRFARSGTGTQAAGALLQESMHRPVSGPPRQPVEVHVTEPELAESIRGQPALDSIRVRCVDECPSWDAVVKEFGAYLAAHWPGRSYLHGGGVGPADVGRFFDAAATFYRGAPWEVLEDAPVELRLGGRPEPLFALVLGRDRMVHGLILYLSEESFRQTDVEKPHPARARGTVAVTFDREDGVPPPMLEERRRHRWALAGPAAFPLPYRQLADGTMREPDAEELDLLSLALHAIAELARRHGARLKSGGKVVEAVQVPGADGDSIARLTVPAEIATDSAP